MKRAYFRFGFTLVEVNLAIFVMAVGVLSMCALYAFGYRENRQSEEDVFATAYADSYLAPLVAGLSSPLLDWNAWQQIGNEVSSAAQESGIDACWPANGWRDYVDTRTEGDETRYRVKSNPKSIADGDVWNKIMSRVPSPYKGGRPSIDSQYQYALVATRRGPVIQLAFRCSRRAESLMSQPLIVSEVHFQGDPDK